MGKFFKIRVSMDKINFDSVSRLALVMVRLFLSIFICTLYVETGDFRINKNHVYLLLKKKLVSNRVK